MGDRVFLLGAILFFTGAGVYSWFWKALPVDENFEAIVGTSTTIEVVVVTEPVRKEDRQRFVSEAFSGRIIVSAPLYPSIVYGDRIALSGVLKKPESFTTENGQLFDYPRYLAKDGVGYTMSFPGVEIVGHGEGNVVKQVLFSIRRAFLRSLERVVPQPGAALLGGITVGAEDGMPSGLEEIFRIVGLVHIIVLSGYNITIVAETIARLLSRFPLAVAWSGSAGSIVLFVIMTGASPATVRAGIMALLVIVARAVGRRYDMGRALLIAGAAMVVHNPDVLLFDPSFQLSFLATLGLLYGSPLVAPFARFFPRRFQIQETVTATLATQIFVLPLLVYRTGMVSVIALLANIIVLPVMPATMLLTFLAGLSGFVTASAANPFGFAAHLLASFVIFIAETLAKVPFASVSVGIVPLGFLVGTYTLLALIVWWHRRDVLRLSPS